MLSFYDAAKKDDRFAAALDALDSKVTDGELVVENPNRRLARFAFCRKNEPSRAATRRYREIQENVGS